MDLATALDRFVAQLRANGRSEYTVMQFSRHVRVAASLTEIDLASISRGALTPHQMKRLLDAWTDFETLKIDLWGDTTATIAKLRGRVRRMLPTGLDLVVVDYLQLLNVPGDAQRVEKVTEISRGLKSIAMEMAVPVLATSQLSRQADHEGEPELHHLRESGAIEQDADAVLLLWASKEDVETNRLQCKLAKNRQGPKGRFEILFRRSLMQIGSVHNHA